MAKILTREELDRDLQNLVGGDLASDEIIREVLAHDAAQRAEMAASYAENEQLRADAETMAEWINEINDGDVFRPMKVCVVVARHAKEEKP